MPTFLKLTRVYTLKGKKAVKEQTVTVRADAIDSVRASNRLGYPEHRSTITLRSGQTLDLSNESKAVVAMLAGR